MAIGNQTGPETPARPRPRWGRRLLVAILLIGVGVAGGFAMGMHNAAAMFWHGIERAKLDPKASAAHIEHKVDRVLSRVDASADQKAKVSAIAKSAVTDILELGISPRETRTKLIEFFRADKIDPEALEALRAQQTAKWDAATKRIVQAMTEAASVLTPEQRRELTDRWYHRDFH